MAAAGTKATVSATGNKVVDAAGTDTGSGASAICIMEGAGPVYIGSDAASAVANATATQGRWDKTIVTTLTFTLQAGEEVWMATASGTCVVQVIKTGA